MVRPTKYFTLEERVEGRKQRRAERNAKPGASLAIAERNRRAYSNRIVTTNAKVTPDPRIQYWGGLPMVVEDESVFSRFREGEDTLPLNEHQDITENDLDELSGIAPYSSYLLIHPSFNELWDEALHPALWGYHTRLYLSSLQTRRERCLQLPPSTLSQEFRREYNELLQQWDIAFALMRAFGRSKCPSSERVALFNCRWIARRILYAAEDLKALQGGSSCLLVALCDRAYDLGRGTS